MSLNPALVLRESAKAHPEKTALAVGDSRLIYEAVDLYARRFAGGLRALGIERGQHVALLVPNVPQFTIASSAPTTPPPPWCRSTSCSPPTRSPATSTTPTPSPSWPGKAFSRPPRRDLHAPSDAGTSSSPGRTPRMRPRLRGQST